MLENNINELSGFEFEDFCKELVEKMGFEVEPTKKTGDGGIDLIAYNHQPFLSGKYIIQCKRYIGSVGEPIVRDLFGVITAENANKGIIITTGTFTESARNFARGKAIELIDGTSLFELCKTYNMGLSVKSVQFEEFMPLFYECKIYLDKIPMYQEDYQILSTAVKSDIANYKARNALVDLLTMSLKTQIKDFELLDGFALSEKEILDNKRKCLDKLINLMEYYSKIKIQTNQDKQMKLISELFIASCRFLQGDYYKAIQGYYLGLEMFITEDVYDDYLMFRAALQIIKNIAKIYEILGLDNKREMLYRKYNRLVEKEYDFAEHQLTYQSNKEYVIEQRKILCNETRTDDIFFNFCIDYFHGIGSLWDEGFENPDEPTKEFFDQKYVAEVVDGKVLFYEKWVESPFFYHLIDESQKNKIEILT